MPRESFYLDLNLELSTRRYSLKYLWVERRTKKSDRLRLCLLCKIPITKCLFSLHWLKRFR